MSAFATYRNVEVRVRVRPGRGANRLAVGEGCVAEGGRSYRFDHV